MCVHVLVASDQMCKWDADMWLPCRKTLRKFVVLGAFNISKAQKVILARFLKQNVNSPRKEAGNASQKKMANLPSCQKSLSKSRTSPI